MTYPTPYHPEYSFTGFQSSSPDRPLPAPRVDVEYANIELALGETQAGLADIRREDGKLVNGIVTAESLDPGMALGVLPPQPWQSGTEYKPPEAVWQDNYLYQCVEQHFSTVFADDLAAGYWSVVVDFNPPIDEAEAWAAAAEASAAEAAASAAGVHADAVAAANSAATASGAATTAINKANAAGSSAQEAKNSETAAFGYATSASNDKNAAANSAAAALVSQNAAASSANSASISASDALASKNAAKTSETNAGVSAGQAITAATNAQTAANQAGASQTAAANSATTASTAATTATTKASEAATSAANAAASAALYPDAPADGTTYGRKGPPGGQCTWQTVVGGAIISDTAPAGPLQSGQLWWESDSGNTYIWYVDPGGGAGQWVQQNVAANISRIVETLVTANGNYVPPAGLKYLRVRGLGGGGAGGIAPATAAAQFSLGSGGGAGAMGESLIPAAALAASTVMVIGQGGSGVSGNPGTDTSFGSLVAGGGAAGASSTAVDSPRVAGGAGGVATGWQINGTGAPGNGGWGMLTTANVNLPGSGGSTPYGGGGIGQFGSGSAAGTNGTGYGSGGSGGRNVASQSAKAGGNGVPGFIHLTEYF